MENTQNEIVNLLKELICIPSVSDDFKALQEITLWVKKYLSIPGLIVEEYTYNDFPSLVIKPTSWKKTRLLVNCHLDVVPGYQEQFKLKIKDDKAYGRGTLDMKGATAVILFLIKELALANKLPNDVTLMLVSDEEIGGQNGTKYLFEQKSATTDFFLAGEPTNLKICNEQKGIIWLELEENGKKAHGSKPWLGTNANITLAEKITNFYKHNPQDTENSWATTYNLSLLQGGHAKNVVSDKATAFMDIRRINKESAKEVLENVRKSFPNTKLNIAFNEPCLITNASNPFILNFQQTIYDKFGEQIDTTRETFASDGRFYSVKNIPSINFGPIGEDMHGDNEWVSIKSLKTYYEYLQEVFLNL